MKKRIILALMLVLAITVSGCGNKKEDATDTGVETVATAEPTEEPEEEPVAEVDVAEPVESTSTEETSTEETSTEETSTNANVGTATIATSEMDMDAFEADEAKDHKFGDMSYVAQYRDIRNTTGLDGGTTEDVWKYLTEDGIIKTENADELWEFGTASYTGRFSYPKLLESEATKDLYLYDWTDSYCSYIADDGESDTAVLFCTGYDVFNTYTTESEDLEYVFEKFKTITANGQDYDVYTVKSEEGYTTYLYKLNGFTAVIEFYGENSGEEILTEVMNDIVL